jgi:hypothetical protein
MAHQWWAHNSYTLALDCFARAYQYEDQDPALNLFIGVIMLHRALHKTAGQNSSVLLLGVTTKAVCHDGRVLHACVRIVDPHHMVMRAFAFLFTYFRFIHKPQPSQHYLVVRHFFVELYLTDYKLNFVVFVGFDVRADESRDDLARGLLCPGEHRGHYGSGSRSYELMADPGGSGHEFRSAAPGWPGGTGNTVCAARLVVIATEWPRR